jgi:RHS repeat-associated protein
MKLLGLVQIKANLRLALHGTTLLFMTGFSLLAQNVTYYQSGTITVINYSTNTYRNVIVEHVDYVGNTEGLVDISPNQDDFTPGSVGTADQVPVGTWNDDTGQWYNLGPIITLPIQCLVAHGLDIYGNGVYTANTLPYAGNGMSGTLFFQPGTLLPVPDPNDGAKKCDGTPSCCGMPVWSVSEPYISLWLKDEPLGYQPATGPRISFGLEFKQREFTDGYDTNFFGAGKRWNCSWLSYVAQDYNTNIVVYFPGGGSTTYYTTNDYLTDTTLSGNMTNGFTVSYPDGSKDVYGFVVTNTSGTFPEAFLSQRWNPQGQKLTLNYRSYSPGCPVIQLLNIVDGDGRTNTISYITTNPSNPNLVSQVTDPFGRSAYLSYNTNGDLTNIIDVASNSTSISYDTNDWPTSMTTPYGTTSFLITDSGTNPPPNGRSIVITRPDSSQEYYLYEDSAPGIASSYSSGLVPGTSPFANTLDNSDLNLRNSFHWGPRQFADLSNTTNLSLLNSNDFLKAHMRHWLTSTSSVVGNTMSLERDPSPDSGGTIAGQMIWYDYAGKTNTEFEGSQIEPLFAARVLPDGTTSFTYSLRNSIGAVTNQVSTYSLTAGGSVLLRTNVYVYDATGVDLLAQTNALGIQVSSNRYNAFNEVLTNYDASNELTAFTYDASNRLTSIKRPTGLLTTNMYGTDGFLAQQIDMGFATNSYTYTNALVYTHTDPRGLATTNTWDALNRLTSMSFPDGSTISNRYTFLDLTAKKDRLGNWTYLGYDNIRRNTSITNALLNVTLFNYCTCGSLESIVDALTNFTYFFYDNQGNPTNVSYADGYSVTRNYDLLRRVVSTTDSGNNNVTNTYNNQGMVIAISNTVGRVQGTVFDLLDRATNSVDANGVSINTTYDNLNRPLVRSYPDNGVEHWAYTLNVSGATGYTNQIGNIMLYGFDAMNRKTNEVTVGVTTNSFAYDGAGDLLTLADGKNQVTTWGYDSFGRVTNKLDAASNLLFVYQYDANNRLTNRWSIAKGGTTYRYDKIGNLTNVDYSAGTVAMTNLSMAYDALNRLTTQVDAVGTTTYSYDQVGQLLSAGGLWPNDTVSYTYANRLRTGLSLPAPNSSAWSQSYGYDTARRLTKLTSPAGIFGYLYDPAQLQRVDKLTLPNGAYITNTYDNVARELSTVLKNSGNTVLDSEGYGYNQGNQRTSETNTAGDFRNYTYDNEGELTKAIGKEAGGVTNRWQEQFGYAYDAAGNLNQRTNNTLVQTFNVNNLNELTTITNAGKLTVAGTTTSPATNVTVNTSNAVLYADTTFASTNQPWLNGNNTFTAIARDVYGRINTNSLNVNLLATNSYGYDLNGNLTNDTTRSFAYDDENQLTSVYVTNQWRSDFVFDGRLRKRIERDFSWNGSSWTQTNEVHYVYDGNLALQERDTNNLPKLTYTRGNDLSGTMQGAGGIGGLLARSDNTQLVLGSSTAHAYYHADGNGNVTALINNLQLIVAKYLYDPFGNTLSLSGPLASANTYRFSSKEWNANAGLYYYLYRFYDPNLQRWPNRDPIQEQGGINLYESCNNDGVDAIDSYGLDPAGNQLGLSLALTYLSLNNTTALNNSQISDVINDPKVQSFGQELLGKARSKWACGKSGSFSAAPSEGATDNNFDPGGWRWAGAGNWQLFMGGTCNWQCACSKDHQPCNCRTTCSVNGTISKYYTFAYVSGGNKKNLAIDIASVIGASSLNPLAVASYVAVFAGNTFIIDQPFHTDFSDSGTANGN